MRKTGLICALAAFVIAGCGNDSGFTPWGGGGKAETADAPSELDVAKANMKLMSLLGEFEEALGNKIPEGDQLTYAQQKQAADIEQLAEIYERVIEKFMGFEDLGFEPQYTEASAVTTMGGTTVVVRWEQPGEPNARRMISEAQVQKSLGSGGRAAFSVMVSIMDHEPEEGTNPGFGRGTTLMIVVGADKIDSMYADAHVMELQVLPAPFDTINAWAARSGAGSDQAGIAAALDSFTTGLAAALGQQAEQTADESIGEEQERMLMVAKDAVGVLSDAELDVSEPGVYDVFVSRETDMTTSEVSLMVDQQEYELSIEVGGGEGNFTVEIDRARNVWQRAHMLKKTISFGE